MLISVQGAGYVGLVTAAALSKLGNVVRCVDTDERRVEQLERGELPVNEPGLAELVSTGVRTGRLTFHSAPSAVRDTAFVIVAVGTLDREGHWTADHVREAVLALARDAAAPRRLVIRSTLMPGTVVSLLEAARAVDQRMEIAHNPEFTREGSAVSDFLSPDRVVIGLAEPAAESELGAWLRTVYEPLDAPIVITDLTSAETIKVASNVFLAAKIAFANELARLADAAGADIHAVVDGIGLDRRIGRSFLTPGPGFGGSCLPSQAVELPRHAHKLGVRTGLLAAIAPSNEDHAAWWIEQVSRVVGANLQGLTVTVLGATFKAGTDDLRDSPALRLVRLLAAQGATIRLYDPVAARSAATLLAAEGLAVTAAADAYDASAGADAVVVATEWPEFRGLDWHAIGRSMRGDVVVDTRSIVDRGAATAAGLRVRGLTSPGQARGPVESAAQTTPSTGSVTSGELLMKSE